MTFQAVAATSLLGRLTALAFAVWDDSLIARSLGALWQFGARVFAGSLFGRFWFSDWPSAVERSDGFVGRAMRGLNGLAARAADRWGPALEQLWRSSLVVRLGEGVIRRVGPWLGTSLLFQAFAGYTAEVETAPSEPVGRRVSPLVWVLGSLLGLLPLIPANFRPMGMPVPSPTVLMMAGVWAVAIFWLGQKLVTRDLVWRASSAFLPLAFLLLVAGAATVQSVSFSDSLMSFLVWVTGVLLFWLTVNLIRTSRDAAALLGPILAGASLMTVWAVYQFFVPPVVEEAWVDPTIAGSLFRSFASLGNPNYLAEYMALFLPLGVALWIQTPGRRLELIPPLLAMVLSLLLSGSRGGWLAALIALMVLVVLRAPRWIIPVGLLGAGLSVFAPGALAARFVSIFQGGWRVIMALTKGVAVEGADTSLTYRLNIWTGLFDMLEKVWVLGAGLGAVAFNKVYQEFMLPEARAAHVHNTYLQVTAEMGILGLIATLWTLLVILRRTVVVGSSPRRSFLLAAVPATLMGMLVHGLVEHIWYNPKLFFAFWAVAGLGMGLALGEGKDAEA